MKIYRFTVTIPKSANLSLPSLQGLTLYSAAHGLIAVAGVQQDELRPLPDGQIVAVIERQYEDHVHLPLVNLYADALVDGDTLSAPQIVVTGRLVEDEKLHE